MGSCLNFATRTSIAFYVSHFDHVGSKATNPSSQSVELNPFTFISIFIFAVSKLKKLSTSKQWYQCKKIDEEVNLSSDLVGSTVYSCMFVKNHILYQCNS